MATERVTFRREKLADVRDEIEPLLRRHYAEIALHKERVPLAPDWGRYEYLELSNALAIFTARCDGVLIGYSVFFLQYHIHYQHTLVAANDILYLDPQHRRGRTGLRLIDYSEEQLRDLGVDRVQWHVKTKQDWSAILVRRSYEIEELIVAKML